MKLQLILGCICALIVGTSVWLFQGYRYDAQIADIYLQAEKDLNAAEQKYREMEKEWNIRLNEARNNEIKRTQELNKLLDIVNTDTNRLQGFLTDSDNRLSTYSRDALIQRATTLSNVFGECVSRYKEMARAADGHVSDKIMVKEAYPSGND